jgi:hypothetical protein
MILFLAARTKDPVPSSFRVVVPGYSISTYVIPLITLRPSLLLSATQHPCSWPGKIDPDDDLDGCWKQIFITCPLPTFTLS